MSKTNLISAWLPQKEHDLSAVSSREEPPATFSWVDGLLVSLVAVLQLNPAIYICFSGVMSSFTRDQLHTVRPGAVLCETTLVPVPVPCPTDPHCLFIVRPFSFSHLSPTTVGACRGSQRVLYGQFLCRTFIRF